MALPLSALPRRPRRPLALARRDADVGARVLTCLRHRSYWLASCDDCRAARRATLNAGDCSALNSPPGS